MISDYFDKLSNSIGEYIEFNKGNLSFIERNNLYDSQIELARLAGEINIEGISLAFQDLERLRADLEMITEKVKKTVQKALAVQDAINIAAGLINIATATISNNPKAVFISTLDLAKALKISLGENKTS